MAIQLKKLSYKEYGIQINKLTIKTKSFLKNHYSETIKKIIAIPRGGLSLGVHLSHHLDLELISSEDYLKYNPKHILVVDDLCDSGKTLEYFKSSLLCCLFIKPRRIFTPTLYLEEVPNNTWIVFPWEKQKQIQINKKYMVI